MAGKCEVIISKVKPNYWASAVAGKCEVIISKPKPNYWACKTDRWLLVRWLNMHQAVRLSQRKTSNGLLTPLYSKHWYYQTSVTDKNQSTVLEPQSCITSWGRRSALIHMHVMKHVATNELLNKELRSLPKSQFRFHNWYYVPYVCTHVNTRPITWFSINYTCFRVKGQMQHSYI